VWMQVSSRQHVHRKICLCEKDLRALSDLMNNGFSFQDSLRVSRTKANQDVYDEMEAELKLGKEGEEIIAKYIQGQPLGYFTGFIQYMTLKDSIAAVLSIIESEKRQKEKIIKGMMYPTMLFIGVNIGIILFDAYVLPVMNTLGQSFSYQDPSLTLMQSLAGTISKAVLTLMGIVLIGAVWCLQPDHIVKTYHLIQMRFPEALIVKYASSDFCRFYLECIRRSISTRESLSILKALPKKPLVREIAAQLDSSLSEGTEMTKAVETCYAESALVQLFHIAVYASNCQAMMEGYLSMVKDRTEHEIQMYSRIVQCVSYGAVGIIIILVYQVLLAPISMMQTL
jgi:competence protein ComGB